MSTRTRILHLPPAMDTRTCSRWACLQRMPGSGLDPAILTSHVQRTVNDVAAIVVEDAEVKGTLQDTEHYVKAFLDRYWPAIPALVGPGYPKSVVAAAEEQGAVCIETLVERTMPRLQYAERLLAHAQSFEWRIPDGAGGELVIPGAIARLGEDRLTGTLRLYEWQIEPQKFPYINAFFRFQHTGVALGWLQRQYPDREVVYAEVNLLSDETWEWRRTAQELHLLEGLLQQQADQAAPLRPFGTPPVQVGSN